MVSFSMRTYSFHFNAPYGFLSMRTYGFSRRAAFGGTAPACFYSLTRGS
jgi:hypothetical protein